MTLLAGCPKHMQYGPCGGVRAGGGCEIDERRCVFVDGPTVRWAGIDGRGVVHERAGRGGVDHRAGHSAVDPAPAHAPMDSEANAPASRMRTLLGTRAIVVADLPARALSADSIESVGRVLAGQVDAVLAGDSGAERVQFSPAYRAMLIRPSGLEVWTGLNCRDRNRVALEGELAALADVGVAGVHCVTGDHTRTGQRPDAAPVFDLDSTELAALAASSGHLVSVAESPLATPVANRPARLVEKLRAGAEVCFVNHCGGAAAAAAFVDAVRALGGDAKFVACVPVVVDAASAALLATFTTLVLPEGYLDGIVHAPDPRAAGIEAAVRLGADLLDAGLDGINLSGGPGDGGHIPYAEAMAEIATRLLH